MSSTCQTLSSILSTDMNYYAGDPEILKGQRYTTRVEEILNSERSDLLTARVAIHAQLREALNDREVQNKLKPFLNNGENLSDISASAKNRAKFFTRKQEQLQADILASQEQKDLKDAHGDLAAWERENAVLLRHQMFMTYMPSQALLLESAATVALYRQYASLEEGEYTSESSDGEVPAMLKKMGGNPKPYFTQSEREFQVDEHTKMYSQQVLQNKRVEYEQLRERVAELRDALIQCPTVKRLEEFVRIRNEIFTQFGMDRLVSLCSRKDKALNYANEGGIDPTLKGLPADDENVTASRVAQYSLPKITEAAYRNYQSILTMDDWDAMVANTGSEPQELIEKLKPLKDPEVFRYWFLSSLTADCPSTGPNKVVGKNNTTMEEYRKFWAVQKSGYLPSITPNRQTFVSKVAKARCLPHIVVLSPATYSYRENNDPNAVKKGTIDLMVYDATNEKVLLMVSNSSDERRPRGAFLNAQEERYRFAAVVRSAITYENQYHGFQCSGTVAEYFFDPVMGPEENYYCVMAPTKVYKKSPTEMEVPVKAFRPFTACPPRYFVLGSNWGVSSGTKANPFPASFSHIELNEDAIAVCEAIPQGFVEQNVLPKLQSREEGLKILEEERKKREAEQKAAGASKAPLRTPRTARSEAPEKEDPLAELEAEEKMGPREEEDPLSLIVPEDVLLPVRDQLLKNKNKWEGPAFMAARNGNSDIKALPAVKDHNLRTPLNVFNEMVKEKFNMDEPVPQSARQRGLPSARRENEQTHQNAERQAANVAWF